MANQPLDLAAIEARCAKATEGPWRNFHWDGHEYIHADALPNRWDPEDGFAMVYGYLVDKDFNHAGTVESAADNAAFIAHARTDIPALLKHARNETQRADAAEAEVRRLRADLHECRCDGWRSRLAESETRCANLKADNERMWRGIRRAAMMREDWASDACQNLAEGREWNDPDMTRGRFTNDEGGE